MLVVNVALVIAYVVLLRRSDTPIDETATVFVVLLTLVVTLFDRFSDERRTRTMRTRGDRAVSAGA
jgi:hypothetical protein